MAAHRARGPQGVGHSLRIHTYTNSPISIPPSPSSIICFRSFLSSSNPSPSPNVTCRHAPFHILRVNDPLVPIRLISQTTLHSSSQPSLLKRQAWSPPRYQSPARRTTTLQGGQELSQRDQNEVPSRRCPTQDSSPSLDLKCTP